MFLLVSEAGLEPARPFSQSLAPQASASANSATPTCQVRFRARKNIHRSPAATQALFETFFALLPIRPLSCVLACFYSMLSQRFWRAGDWPPRLAPCTLSRFVHASNPPPPVRCTLSYLVHASNPSLPARCTLSCLVHASKRPNTQSSHENRPRAFDPNRQSMHFSAFCAPLDQSAAKADTLPRFSRISKPSRPPRQPRLSVRRTQCTIPLFLVRLSLSKVTRRIPLLDF